MAPDTYDLPEDNAIQTGRSRLLQVFRYLEALNQQRNPVKRQIDEQLWTLWFHDLPEHHFVRVGMVESTGGVSADSSTEHASDDFVLRVRRPQITKVPPPPAYIREWLRPGWDDVNKEVSVIESDEVVTADGKEVITRFDDDPDRVAEFTNWLKSREEWVKREKPTREALRIFDRVYELYGQIEREAEGLELILGDGLLVWRRPEGGIRHPILLQRLQLEFNPEIPEFTFRETQHPVEFYSALFRAMADVDGRMIAKVRDELEQGAFHPLDGGSTSGFLRGFIQRLAKDGEFTDRAELQGETDQPRIARDPVIFVRSRTLGFATALEAILEELPNLNALPVSLLNIVGVEALPHLNSTEASELLDGNGNEDEEILFNKPANQEQLQIAQRLEKHRCVLVQGPPGTGKTHTIANLIGHLLAQGQSVLVTSHKSEALEQVRNQVASELRSLCVSLLKNDAESRQQLESSINEIVQRLTSDPDQLERKAQELKAQRTQLIRALRENKKKCRMLLRMNIVT